MASSTRKPLIFFFLAIAIIALFFGIWTQRNTHASAKPTTIVATVLYQPRQIIPFKLTEDNGKPFNNANFKGHWSLLFFGFTRCPEICPTTLSTLNKAYQAMQHNKLSPMPQVVFISVDPDHDAAKGVIKKYLTSFNKNFIGATGSKKQLDQLTQNLSVLYMKVMNKDAMDDTHYMIDHSGTILLINPQGDLKAIFSTPHQAGVIAKDVAKIIKHNA